MTYDNKSDAYRQRNCRMTYELYELYEVHNNKKRKKVLVKFHIEDAAAAAVKRWNKILNET